MHVSLSRHIHFPLSRYACDGRLCVLVYALLSILCCVMVCTTLRSLVYTILHDGLYYMFLLHASLYHIVWWSVGWFSPLSWRLSICFPMYTRLCLDACRYSFLNTVYTGWRSVGWVGFGLTPNGGMVNADVIMAWIDDDTQVQWVKEWRTTVSRFSLWESLWNLSLISGLYFSVYGSLISLSWVDCLLWVDCISPSFVSLSFFSIYFSFLSLLFFSIRVIY